MEEYNGQQYFTARLKIVLDASRLTRRDFAVQLGLSPQYLRDLLSGKRSPSVYVIDAIIAFERERQWPDCSDAWHAVGALAHGWKVEVP